MRNVQKDLKSDQYQHATQRHRDMVIMLKVRKGKKRHSVTQVDVLFVGFV